MWITHFKVFEYLILSLVRRIRPSETPHYMNVFIFLTEILFYFIHRRRLKNKYIIDEIMEKLNTKTRLQWRTTIH
jgi:hypothetical protein